MTVYPAHEKELMAEILSTFINSSTKRNMYFLIRQFVIED